MKESRIPFEQYLKSSSGKKKGGWGKTRSEQKKKKKREETPGKKGPTATGSINTRWICAVKRYLTRKKGREETSKKKWEENPQEKDLKRRLRDKRDGNTPGSKD